MDRQFPTSCQPLARCAVAAVMVVLAGAEAHAGTGADSGPSAAHMPKRRVDVHTLASAFVPNGGQWTADALFASHAGNVTVRADARGLWLGCSAKDESGASSIAVFRLGLESVGNDVSVVGERRSRGTWNYFLGHDESRWRTGLPGYSALRWRDVRPGVDFVLERVERTTLLQYSLECAPGTGDRPLGLVLEGADELVVDLGGGLVARTPIGELRQSKPRAWEVDASGDRREIGARFVLDGERGFAIEVPGRDDSQALFVDPGLEWAAYVGGGSIDLANDLVLSDGDEPVVVGSTASTDFPTTPGTFQSTDPWSGYDAFAMRVARDGASLVFATYVGGSNTDVAWGAAVRPDGRVLVVGQTQSTNFPVTPGASDTQLNGSDAFVTELRPDGASLGFSTFLGGGSTEVANAVDVWPNGEIAVSGQTWSSNFPGTGSGAQAAFVGGPMDAFVARLAADGSALINATYLGGPGEEYVTDSALLPDGSLVVVGETNVGGYPISAGAYDTTYSAVQPNLLSAVITRFTPSLDGLEFSTYLDGTLSSYIYGVDATESRIVVTGRTSASEFPTTAGAFDTEFNGINNFNGFVAALTIDGSSLAYSSFLGASGIGSDAGLSVDIDASDTITITGWNLFDPFPATPGAVDDFVGALGIPDISVMRFKPDGSALLYATLLGAPPGTEAPTAIAIDSHGHAVVSGNVTQDSFPTTPSSFDPTYGGGAPAGFDEGFLASLEMQPLGVTAFGSPTSACKGPIRLTALHVPTAGNAAFGVACTGAPPGAFGVLALSGTSLPTGIPLLGAVVYLDVTLPLVLKAASADSLGYDEIALPIPPSAAGIQFFAQAAWLDTGGCGGGLALFASDALQITVSVP